MEEILFRLAKIEDYEALCVLIKQVDDFHLQLYPNIFRPVAKEARTNEEVVSWLNADNSWVFLAEKAGEIIALARIMSLAKPEHPSLLPKKYLLLDMMVVEETHRGKGIGKAFFEKIKQWMKTLDIPDLELKVYAKNQQAIQFYQQLGFQFLNHQMHLTLD